MTAANRPPVSEEPHVHVWKREYAPNYRQASEADDWREECACGAFRSGTDRPPVSGEPRGSHAEMEGSQGHDFWLPPVSGEPSRPWGSADAALHDAVWTMAASARIPVERREEFAQMGMALIRSELAIRRLAIEAEASTGAALNVAAIAEAWGNVMDGRRVEGVRLNPGVTNLDDWLQIAAEYARLAEQEGESR